MNWKKQIKAANSKGQLVKHIAQLQRALNYYADENNWAVKGEAGDICWLGISDPTYVANRLLGRAKADSGLEKELMDNMSGNRTESKKENGPENQG